jgi:hypothetical protein
MPKRWVPPKYPLQKSFRRCARDRTPCAEETPVPLTIDELAASPWVGLHYRYEFLLHYRHELLEQHPKELARSFGWRDKLSA